MKGSTGIRVVWLLLRGQCGPSGRKINTSMSTYHSNGRYPSSSSCWTWEHRLLSNLPCACQNNIMGYTYHGIYVYPSCLGTASIPLPSPPLLSLPSPLLFPSPLPSYLPLPSPLPSHLPLPPPIFPSPLPSSPPLSPPIFPSPSHLPLPSPLPSHLPLPSPLPSHLPLHSPPLPSPPLLLPSSSPPPPLPSPPLLALKIHL